MANFSVVALRLLLSKKSLLARTTPRMRLPFVGFQLLFVSKGISHTEHEGRSNVKVPMSPLLIAETEQFKYSIHKFEGGH
jgi:hypothetical protein